MTVIGQRKVEYNKRDWLKERSTIIVIGWRKRSIINVIG